MHTIDVSIEMLGSNIQLTSIEPFQLTYYVTYYVTYFVQVHS